MSVLVHQHPTHEFLQKVAESRPFTSQLDVVFTGSEEFGGLLSALRTSYYRSTMTFTEVFSVFDTKHSTLALSVGSRDVWSIDRRAILTLTLAQRTYESLGIVGTPLGPVRRRDTFLVTLDLHDSSRHSMRARECLRQWDARRAEAGKGGWDVLLSSPLPPGSPAVTKWDVDPFVRSLHDIRIPSRVLPTIKPEDAHEELSTLFEWVGMASLGSQRLQANDAVNPYVASYSFPAAWPIESSLTHVRWTGLLTPAFVQSVLSACLGAGVELAAITASPSCREGKGVWTLVVSKKGESSSSNGHETDCVLAECIK